jgi:hypothetical protein
MAVKDKNGRWIDATGQPVPPKYINQVDKKRDALVERLNKVAVDLNKRLADFRVKVLDDVEKYLSDLETQYDVEARTKEGNKMLSNFSNTLRMEVKINKFIEFDERLAIAKEIIDDCIRKWSQGADDKITVLVMDAFKVDKKGKIDRDRVLGLKKLNIKDKDWAKAMDIIYDSIVVVGARAYLRFSMKDESGRWQTIPLDIAAC